MEEVTEQKYLRKSREEFDYYSSSVKGEGDEDLPEDASMEEWTKVIILKPTGKNKTIISPGFETVFGDVLVSNATRRVGSNPFGMRMGPEDCQFFVVSNEGEVGLEFVEYAHIDDDRYRSLPLY